MDAQGLIDYLAPEPDELAVASVILRKTDGRLHLVAGSLLVGPPQMAESSWPEWRRLNGHNIGYVDFPQPEFLHAVGALVAGRAVASLGEAVDWLAELFDTKRSTAIFPAFDATLGPATAPIQVFPKTSTPASHFITAAMRPVRAFFFPSDDAWEPLAELDTDWTVSDQGIAQAPHQLLGISPPGHVNSTEPAAGLLLGRLERRAWLAEIRGGDGLETFEAHIGLEAERIDISDLEIDYEQRIGGEIILNKRLRLEDVPTPDMFGTDKLCVVSLPTVGSKIAHAITLWDRDGALLDKTDSNYLIERISITLNAGGKSSQISAGAAPVPLSLVGRAVRIDEVIEMYREWLEKGIDGKVFDDEKVARKALAKHLQASRGQLSIVDPYFGKPRTDGTAEKDWALLSGLSRSTRVLTSERANPIGPLVPIPGLQARCWKANRRPPFHDRLYLWEGGGVNVGTSPNGFGGRLFRMQRLGSVEAQALLLRFDAWWSSTNVKSL